MACAIIRVFHPLTATVRYWRSNTGIVSNISGSIVFHQETQFDSTKAKVDLHGLNAMAAGYHIHKVYFFIDSVIKFVCIFRCGFQ